MLPDKIKGWFRKSDPGVGPREFDWWEVDPNNEERLRHRDDWLPVFREDKEGFNRFQREAWLLARHVLAGRGYRPDSLKRQNANGQFFELVVAEPEIHIFLAAEAICWKISGTEGSVTFVDVKTPWSGMMQLASEIRKHLPYLPEPTED